MVVGVVHLHVVFRGDAAAAAGDEALQTSQLLLATWLSVAVETGGKTLKKIQDLII